MKKSLNILFVLIFTFSFLVLPALTFAAPSFDENGLLVANCDTSYAEDPVSRLICKTGLVLNQIIPVLITLGTVYFIYGVISYAISKDEEAKTKGRSAMINGIIALAVIVSLWGLVNILKKFALGNTTDPKVNIPCVGIGCGNN